MVFLNDEQSNSDFIINIPLVKGGHEDFLPLKKVMTFHR
jgi:hypothetical protein